MKPYIKKKNNENKHRSKKDWCLKKTHCPSTKNNSRLYSPEDIVKILEEIEMPHLQNDIPSDSSDSSSSSSSSESDSDSSINNNTNLYMAGISFNTK